MAWGFAERIGTEVGYSPTEIGQILSLQQLRLWLGSMGNTYISHSFGDCNNSLADWRIDTQEEKT